MSLRTLSSATQKHQPYSMVKQMSFILLLGTAISWMSCEVSKKPAGVPFEKAKMVLELNDTKLLVSEVAWGLDEPWEITWGPDDHIWVTQHKGVVKRLNPNTGEIKDMVSIPDVYFSRTPGLMAMVLHPDFDTDPFVYLHYTYVDSAITEIDNYGRSSNVRSRIVRYRFYADEDTLKDAEIILPNIPGSNHHNGSRMTITADKKIIFTIGDTGNRKGIRNKNILVGKVMRLNLDGSVPDDNPVAGSYFYSTGHRNPQGVVEARGNIYISEHGPNNDDEINLIKPMADYGWPHVEGYCDNENEMAFCDSITVTEPIFTWTPTIAPAGLDYYDHPAIPEWENCLLLTTLKGRSLQLLRLDASGEQIIDQEFYLQQQFGRFRDLCVAPSGEIYLVTSNTDWHINRNSWMYTNVPKEGNDRIVKLSPIDGTEYPDLPAISKDSAQIQLFTAERINFEIPGTAAYIQQCAPCHLPSGQGIANSVPPLVDTEWTNDRNKLIESTLNGITGKITVKGQTYDGLMPGFAVTLTDQQIAEILNYVLITLNNYQVDEITAIEVGETRDKLNQL